MKKFGLAILFVLTINLLLPLIALADISQPDITFTINQINAYRNALELNDQLYTIEYTIEYTTDPTEGTANDLFICRLMNGVIPLRSTAPYSLGSTNSEGFQHGIMSIYFSSEEVSDLGLTWESDTYSVNLEGNPTLDWVGGDPPVSTLDTITSWYDGNDTGLTGTVIRTRMVILSNAFFTDWGLTADDALMAGEGSDKVLTELGEEYFGNVILNLRLISPSLFAAVQVNPDISDNDVQSDYFTGGSDSGSPVYDTNYLSQSFNASGTYDLDRIEVKVSKVQDPGTVTVSVYDATPYIVENGEFTENLNNWSSLGGAAISRNYDIFNSSPASARVIAAGAWSDMTQTETTTDYQGLTYGITFSVMLPTTNAGTHSKVVIADNTGWIANTINLPVDDTWHNYSLSGAVNGAATNVQIIFYPTTDQATVGDLMYVDDVVQTDGQYIPIGTSLGSTTINGTTFTNSTSGLWEEVAFTTPVSIDQDSQYAIVLNNSGSITTHAAWNYNSDGGYDNGAAASSIDSGVTWTVNEVDFMFITKSQGSGAGSFANKMTGKLVGTPLDAAAAGEFFGVSGIWILTIIWLFIMAGAGYVYIKNSGTKDGLLFLILMMTLIGAAMVFINFLIITLFALLAIVYIGYNVFLKRAS